MKERVIDEHYIAKTGPERKDIQWHTDDLLDNLNLLKILYPNLQVDWNLLRLACTYHDLGKMNGSFQAVMHRKGKSTGMPHGLLSLGFIDVEYLEDNGYSDEEIELLFHAVAYHHERDFHYTLKEIYDEIRKLQGTFQNFIYAELPTRYLEPEFDMFYFKPGQRLYESKDDSRFFQYVMLKGLLNRLDYAASAGIPIEHKNDFLMDCMDRLLTGWKQKNPKTDWNDLQKHMLAHQEENVIVIAQTGMGKTEAGLLWLGNNKGFFTLPLKSAINAIYERVKENIICGEVIDKVGLLHSDTIKIYAEREAKRKKDEDDLPEFPLEYYYSSTKQLSLPVTICTLDQIFDFVYRYKGFEPKLATLAYSRIIIDEIQMYSADLVAYLILGLSYITRLGGKYAILTATLPELILDFMEAEGLHPPKPVEFTNDLRRHSVKIIEAQIDAEESILQMAEAFSGNKILIICNTIKRAKLVYEKLKEILKDSEKSDIYLLHSGFIRKDRTEKEKEIMKTGARGSKVGQIWVSTQIVEASLDIDFDILFTELSDLNGLFQRMGRCYRHRMLDVDYNCFVFTGGNKKCSGVGEHSVIEPEIHTLSKKFLNIDGVISEQEKVNLVKCMYSSGNLLNTDYYQRISNTLQYVKDITEYEYSRQEVAHLFRNIDQASVIPLVVYLEYESKIKANIELMKNGNGAFDKKAVNAREAIRDLMVPVQSRLAHGTVCGEIRRETKELGFEILVVDAEYSKETGISFENTQNQAFKDAESRFF